MFFKDQELNNIIISIIWGFGIACLFKKMCHTKNCVIIKSGIKNNNIKKNNKCYKNVVNCK